MKLITGFFMAWGNFLTLPCPLKRWDNKLKNTMLAFLPSAGVVLGLAWMGVYWILSYIDAPEMLSAAAMVFCLFAGCGFMHLDGFMDCSDAILSRRPLAERQRILKDSAVGAFAVVSVIFLLMIWLAAMAETVDRLTYGQLLILPVVSRGISGLHVLTCKAIGHSQYAEDEQVPGRWKYRLAVIAQICVFAAAAFFADDMARKTFVCGLVTAAGTLLACSYSRRQLGGMSGDIAGYGICFGELAGMIYLAF